MAYAATILVSPDPQSAVKSGTHLLTALGSITDNSVSKPYLVKVEPGVYDLESHSLELKPYVDFEGSGQGTTTVSATAANPATIIGANNSEVRGLSGTPAESLSRPTPPRPATRTCARSAPADRSTTQSP